MQSTRLGSSFKFLGVYVVGQTIFCGVAWRGVACVRGSGVKRDGRGMGFGCTSVSCFSQSYVVMCDVFYFILNPVDVLGAPCTVRCTGVTQLTGRFQLLQGGTDERRADDG